MNNGGHHYSGGLTLLHAFAPLLDLKNRPVDFATHFEIRNFSNFSLIFLGYAANCAVPAASEQHDLANHKNRRPAA